MRTTVIAFSIGALLLAGCSQDGQSGITKQDVGTVLGAVGGAVIGAQFGGGTGQLVGVAAGTLLGAFVGSQVGKSLDRADQNYMEQTNQRALETNPSGQTSTWKNPDSGNAGTVTPTKTVQQANGTYCREYTQTITVGGKTESAYGTACRQPDGSWKVTQ